MTTIKRYPDFLTQSQCAEISEWLKPRPYSKTKYTMDDQDNEVIQYRNKNLDLQLSTSLVAKILNPLILQTFGQLPTHGSLLESHYPFGLHVDTVKSFDNKEYESLHQEYIDISFLIPLNQGPGHQTVFFDYFSELIDDDLKSASAKTLQLDIPKFQGVEDLSHLTNAERHLLNENNIVASDYETWQIGNAFTWPRRQLHCAGNFYTQGVKEAITLFF